MSQPEDDLPNDPQAEAPRAPAGDGPSLLSGFVAGLFAALVGSFLWGLLAFATALHLEWVPLVGMGLIVGMTVGSVGQGTDARFGLLAAFLAQLACFLSQLMPLWGAAIFQLGYLPQRPFHLQTLAALFRDQWRPIDIIPYAIAAWEGFYFGNRRPRPRPAQHTAQRKATALVLAGFALLFGALFVNSWRTSSQPNRYTPRPQMLPPCPGWCERCPCGGSGR
jgi:hypothetical protein